MQKNEQPSDTQMAMKREAKWWQVGTSTHSHLTRFSVDLPSSCQVTCSRVPAVNERASINNDSQRSSTVLSFTVIHM